MTLRRPLTRAAAALAGALALTASLAVLPASAAPKAVPPGRAAATAADDGLTVMTRNLYLGADIGRPLRGVAGTTGLAALLGLGNASAAMWDVVESTDFPARSRLLAREIAQLRPDVVGLQEVAWWRTGPPSFLGGFPPHLGDPFALDSVQTVHDFLDTLEGDLAALGVPYEVVSEQVQSDVEGPAFVGNPLADPAAAATARDYRLTMRDVMLRRTGSEWSVADAGGEQYAARLDLSPLGVPYAFVRGYNWADLTHGGKTVRVVNTHLESQFSYLAALQARELVSTGHASVVDRPVVIVCDCNSDPLDSSQKVVAPGVLDEPHDTAYRLLTQLAGFHDAWLQVAAAEQGWTSGLSETVDDTPADARRRLDHRIDLVLTRGLPPAASGVVTGTHPANRTASGLWPSDHAGVVVRLRP
ncbi:MAG TPA: endonuclease/exonuclease/phosphatase family protein [Mycobacteriales bacterium]|nr:endonuclease/exonuclease/phosphatase family protein [Mycobacteriales bacterium]